MIQMETMQKLTTFVNAVLMGFVVMMVGFFAHFGVTYMVYHSIPTICMYILFFFLIRRKHLTLYMLLVYLVITIYMIAATVCLGYSYGFHLYCMSLVPLTFYSEYLGRKLQIGRPFAKSLSVVLVLVYLLCSSYAVLRGPVYEINAQVAALCLNINAVSVFFFLIGYASLLQKMVLDSEDQLSGLAHTDQLTGLFNRHYMSAHLRELHSDMTESHWAAMADIDNFKQINDQYGHSCGDAVLIKLSDIMKETCAGGVICRWGGEEFLITADDQSLSPAILEKLRHIVEHTPVVYEGQEIPVTITIGMSRYQPGQTFDSWIQSADHKLYDGKNSGRNRVVY